MVDVNVKGVLWSIAAALPIFREQGYGHFIAVASTEARKTVPNMAVYSRTKAAIAAICDCLRQELAGGLRVTTLTPGFTATGFADHIRDDALRNASRRVGRSRCRRRPSQKRSLMPLDSLPVSTSARSIRPTAQA